jgi:hypothetical protein
VQQLKERVEGHSAGIDGSHASRRRDGHALESWGLYFVKKRGFAGASSPGKKDVLVRIPDKIESKITLRVGDDAHSAVSQIMGDSGTISSDGG